MCLQYCETVFSFRSPSSKTRHNSFLPSETVVMCRVLLSGLCIFELSGYSEEMF